MERLFGQHWILEDAIARLSPMTPADLVHLQPFALEESNLWQYALMQVRDAEDMRLYITQALADQAAGRAYPWTVFDKRRGQYAGSTRFYDIQADHQTLLLGYTWYGAAFQGTGLNTHCKYLLLQFAFETLGMERVEFRADNRNTRSIAAMKKIGCTVEGMLRSHMPTHDGTRRDSLILSILRPEWETRVKTHLTSQLIYAPRV